MPSVTDLSAVFLCTVSPALSAVLLVALKLAENAIVGVLGGAKGNNDTRTLRLRVKVVLEAVLQIASAAILVKMAALLVGELYEVVYSEAAEDSLGASDGLSYNAAVSVGAGIIIALILVHLAEGGGHGEHTASDKKENGDEYSSSSRGVMLAMLIHTCAEGLAAGLVMSASKATSPSSSSSSLNTGGESDDELKSMFDITSSYFVSLLLHNVSEGLVVATAVKSELEEKSPSNGSSSSASWFLPTLVKTTLSHLGQPLGLLTVLFAPQLGLAGVSEMPLVVAFIQGVSFGSIAAAILLESLPEVWSSCQSVWSAFLGRQQSVEKKKMD